MSQSYFRYSVLTGLFVFLFFGLQAQKSLTVKARIVEGAPNEYILTIGDMNSVDAAALSKLSQGEHPYFQFLFPNATNTEWRGKVNGNPSVTEIETHVAGAVEAYRAEMLAPASAEPIAKPVEGTSSKEDYSARKTSSQK